MSSLTGVTDAVLPCSSQTSGESSSRKLGATSMTGSFLVRDRDGRFHQPFCEMLAISAVQSTQIRFLKPVYPIHEFYSQGLGVPALYSKLLFHHILKLRGPGRPVARRNMKLVATALLLVCLVSWACGQPNRTGGPRVQNINILPSGSQPSSQGQGDYFTGSVRIDPLVSVIEPSRLSGARVTFEPGARTAWHKHPLGQTLIVTAGIGWVQQQGRPVQEFREGDVVRIPPGVKHWHGATATTQMTHIALQEQLDGKAVDWMEKVTDKEYQR
jgi:quercetin dioxygenase-like cupin family protein